MGELFTTPGGLWRRLPRYLAVAPYTLGRRVLDLSAGDGRGAAWLAAGRARDVVGAVADADAAAACERRLGRPGLAFVEADPRSLPFPDRSFDAVLALDGELFHAGGDGALAEVRRVLAPGGFFAASLDNPARRALPVAGETGGAPGDGSGHGLHLTLRRRFATVRLVGQTPIVGFLFGDLGAPEGGWHGPAVSVDLLEGDPGEHDAWLALCWDDGPGAAELDPTLIRLPFDALADHLLAEAADREARTRDLLAQGRQAEEFQQRLYELEVALEAAREEEGGPEVTAVRASRATPESALADDETRRLRGEVTARQRRIEDLEAELGRRAGRHDELGKLVAALEDEVGDARRAGAERGADLLRERRERARLAAEVGARDARIEQLERRLYLGEDGGDDDPLKAAWRDERERASALEEALRRSEDRVTDLEAERMAAGRHGAGDA